MRTFGAGFNRNIWAQLEGQVRDWLRARGGGFVITGPLFWDPAEEDTATADGFVEYNVIGPGSVSVPTHFFKIVVACSQGRNDAGECVGEMSAIAFVLSNEVHQSGSFAPYIRSVDWIEERSGLDFLPELDAAAADQLESAPSALWQ
jgi:endonuclease G